MGAIFGVIGLAAGPVVAEMGRRLAHRAPRTTIERPAAQIVLGAVHRDGVMPFARNGARSIIADGVLYNATELAQALGRPPAGPGAVADLLLAVYEQHGLAGIERVHGDFVAVIAAPDEIVVMRDFLGPRPLYYARPPEGGLVFATEYKAILAVPEIPAVADLQMVQELQCSKRPPVGRTLLRDVHEALPGVAARFSPAGAPLDRHAMPPIRVDIRIRDEAEAAEAIRSGFAEAVRRRTADVERLGVALSGGIDSIGTAFMLRKLYPDRPIATFTVGDDPDDPEMVTAAAVAERIGAEHHPLVLGPDAIERDVEALVWHLEDPVSRSEALQLFALARTAKGRIDVLFTGQGADIEFAGMPSYKLLWVIQEVPSAAVRRGLHEFLDLNYHARPPEGVLGRLCALAYHATPPPPPRVPGATLPALSEIPPFGPEFVNEYLAANLQDWICTDAHKCDRGFGAAGIEFRTPFYDLDFIRMCYTITSGLKIKAGKQKYILRKALHGIVDDTFLQVPKRPQRMRDDLAMAQAIDRLAAQYLSPEQVRARGWFEPASVAALIRRDKGAPYAPETAMRVWTAALTEIWARHFVDRRGAAPG